MEAKPIIVHVEGDSYGFNDDNYRRDALRYVLGEDCGCRVVPFDNYSNFNKEFENIKKYFDDGLLILIILKREKYSNEDMEAIHRVGLIFGDLPIALLCDEDSFQASGEGNVRVFGGVDPELIDFVKYYVENWHPSNNYFSVLTQNDASIVMHQLEDAYKNNYSDEEDEPGAFGVSDNNHRILVEAMRLRLFPNFLIKSEFDDSIGRNKPLSVPLASLTYQSDIQRIRLMEAHERDEFEKKLMRANGCNADKVNFASRTSCGANVYGFAIDVNTLESYITNDYGKHHLAKSILARRLEAIRLFRKDSGDNQPAGTIIPGLILNLLDFASPFLCLWQEDGLDDETFKRVALFLIKKQQFIPVTVRGKLIAV